MNLEVALEQAGVKRLLGQLLERLEKNPARDRAPMQKLDGVHMPEFGPNRRPGEGDAAWKALRALEAAGFLTIDPVRPRIDQAEYETSPRIRLVIDREEELRSLAGIPRKGPGPQQLWREALARTFGAADPRVDKLAAYRVSAIEGRSLDDIAGQFRRLCIERPADGWPLRTVSSRYFWGDSKYLDDRADALAAALGLLVCPYPEMRIQLSVHIRDDEFRDVVIVENQDTFDVVCNVTQSHPPAPVILCAHGFKASAGRIRARAGCLPLYSSHSGASKAGRERFERWLFRELNEALLVWFWGDLDWEAMRILRALREEFSNTRAWPVGYRPMLEAMRSGHGHAPAQARKDRQRPLDETGCEFADAELIPTLMRTGRFLDQEVVVDEQLRAQLIGNS